MVPFVPDLNLNHHVVPHVEIELLVLELEGGGRFMVHNIMVACVEDEAGYGGSSVCRSLQRTQYMYLDTYLNMRWNIVWNKSRTPP